MSRKEDDSAEDELDELRESSVEPDKRPWRREEDAAEGLGLEEDGGGAVKCEKQLRTMKPRWERRKRCAAVTTRVIHSNPAINNRGMPLENIECEALLDAPG